MNSLTTTPCPFHAAKMNASTIIGMLVNNATNGHEHHNHHQDHSMHETSNGGMHSHHGHMMGDDDMMIVRVFKN
jgi:hypothetical protein